MKASDIVSSSKVAVTGATGRKPSHLKLVGRNSKGDSDTSDALSALFGKGVKAKGKAAIEAKADAKAAPKAKADDTLQGQFSALLDQVEQKLSFNTNDQDDTKSDDEADAETSDAGDKDTSALKSQNGTTSLFANAFMMRGFEPALLSPADTKPAKDEAPGKSVLAANSNKIEISNKSEVAAKPADGKTEAKSTVAPAQLKVVDAPQKPASKTEARSADEPQVQISAEVKAGAQVQTTVQARADVKTDSQVIADAQAQGVVGEIHVIAGHETNNESSRDPDQGQDEPRKDQSLVSAKADASAQPAVKVDATAAVVASQQPAAPSPVSQVVERILQELPAANATANLDQVAEASKVMTVRLHPEGLGNVMVRISNSGGSLKISLASDQQATAEQLESDSSQLLQALQQVMPSFSADNLSFSTNDQGSKDAQNGNANPNLTGGNSNTGQWNEGRSNAEQGGRQVPNQRSYGRFGQDSNEAPTGGDAGRRPGTGNSLYL